MNITVRGDLSILGTVHADEGEIMGPVTPTIAELQPGVSWTFILAFQFILPNRTDQVLHGDEFEVNIEGMVRRGKIDRFTAWPGDSIVANYALHTAVSSNEWLTK